MYAIIRTGGKQYKIAPGESLEIDRIQGAEGTTVHFDEVLLIGFKEPNLSGARADGEEHVVLGQPTITGAKIDAEVVRHFRGEKIEVFKYKKRKNFRRRNGFRAEKTEVRIIGIHRPIHHV